MNVRTGVGACSSSLGRPNIARSGPFALIRRSETVEVARSGLMRLLDIDELQANAILEMQLRRLAALERQKIQDQAAELEQRIEEAYNTEEAGDLVMGIYYTEYVTQ